MAELKPGAAPAPSVKTQWAEVERFLDAPENAGKVGAPAARRLLQLHHRLDGFDLPENLECKLAGVLGLDPRQAREAFVERRAAEPKDAPSFAALGHLLVDDLTALVKSLPAGPIRALQDILSETREVLARSKAEHLSKSERKALRVQFDQLHAVLRDHMAGAQQKIAATLQARDALLSDPTGAPRPASALDARQTLELQRLEHGLAELRREHHELGNVGIVFSTLRTESLWEQNFFVANAGVELTALRPLASVAVGGVREMSVRDERTGQRESQHSVSTIGTLSNGFARKVVSAEDLRAGQWRRVLGTKGLGGGMSPIPFVNVVRDPVVGDVIGVFVPGIGFAELNARPDGKAGFGAGLTLHVPGLPIGPHVSMNWNHPLMKPVVSRIIAPLSRIFGYAIRSTELGLIEPGKAALARLRGRGASSPAEG